MVGTPRRFEETLIEVTTAMEDVRAQGAILDSQRLHAVDQTVRELDVRYTETQSDMKSKPCTPNRRGTDYLTTGDVRKAVDRQFGKNPREIVTRSPSRHQSDE